MVPHHQLRVEGAVVATSASMTATTTLTYVEDHVQDAMVSCDPPDSMTLCWSGWPQLCWEGVALSHTQARHDNKRSLRGSTGGV